DRLADVVHLVLRQGVLGAAVGQRGVGDQHRQGIGHRSGEVVIGVHRHDTLDVQHRFDVDVHDARMGVRTSQYGDLERVRQQVVDVLSLASYQTFVLDATNPLTQQFGCHDVLSS